MKRVTLFSFAFFLVFTSAVSQRIQPLNKTGSTEISLDVTVDDYGPTGKTISIGRPNDMVDSVTLTGYPKLKHLPDSLKGLRVFTIIRNQMQFYYQNYRNGIYSKQFFLDKLKNSKKSYKDTTELSNQMVKCYFSFAVGYDRSNNAKFVIDTNGNNDFADEKLLQLNKSSNSLDFAFEKPISFIIEYFDGKNVCQEKIQCSLNQVVLPNSKNKIDVGVSFPQFKYAVLSYEGEKFYVCADLNYICILPYKPNFKELPNDQLIRLNQIATVGNAYFKYEKIMQNENKISLISGFTELDKKQLNSSPIVPSISAQKF